ncbi:hypothetical protein I316_05904 [Kwoniella heveanensis BCC8398]|uniref:Sugar phosphate transporter domain-containing protein n=1 Tax=Kwoniella heveanensis BCC8398 TaxID=1296120 RepID=A0A1B9GNA4_9TREE|nr:hypothetical protein I316_05904 [Kwoniella heveanensis BCC8398]
MSRPSSLSNLSSKLFSPIGPNNENKNYMPLTGNGNGYEKENITSPMIEKHEASQLGLANESNAGPSRLKVFLTVSFHICIALSVTLLNKWALNTVPLPQVLLAFQTGICVILSVIVKAAGWGSVGSLNLPMSEVQRLWVYLVMRTVAVGMKVWCLNLVPASFYQVSRGLLLPITVLLSFLFLGNRTSPAILFNILIICVGFVIGSASKLSGSGSGSGSASASSSMSGMLDLGFILGIASTFTTAAETIIVKIYAPKLPIFRAVYTTSLVGFIAFTGLSYISGGFDDFSHLLETARINSAALASSSVTKVPANITGPTYAGVVSAILVSGVAYYLVSLAAVLQITVTTPVTHTISTAVRGVLQSLLAVVLLPNESLSFSAIVSIFFILVGSARYTWYKEKEKKEKEAAAARANITG